MTSRAQPDLAATLMQLSGMPESLRQRKQWLLWRFEQYEGDKKPRKVPVYASGRKRHGQQGSEEDLAELVTFNVAVSRLAGGGRFDGIGFAFLPGDGLIGIDVDGAVDPDTGEVSPLCMDVIAKCASYTELSPSGRGIHVIVEGQCETFKDNAIGLEVFCGRQYFTCTGRHWEGTPHEVRQISEDALAWLREQVEASRAAAQAAKARPRTKQPRGKPVQAPDGGEAPSDFQRVNDAAMANLDAWVPALFPGCRPGGAAGGYRVSSESLGRDLQEDLAITPTGIVDWGLWDLPGERGGREGRRTPIDLVVEHMGAAPLMAMVWLARRLGLQVDVRKPTGAAGSGLPPPEAYDDAPPPRGGREPDVGQSTPSPDSVGGGDPRDAREWRRQLLKTSEGGKKDCRENVFLMLTEHPELKGLVAFDEFAHRINKMRAPPWDSTPGEWTPNDDYELGLWLAMKEHLVVKAEGSLVAGVAMAAFRARYHPVQRYLKGLEWDGIERLPFWLSECLGAVESTYTRLVGKFFIMGMVNRVLHPGCQMDNMLVLEGGQGKGKSTALRVLAGEWFADTPIRIGDKDSLLNLAGVWLYEVGELDAFNKAEVTAVKQYVSSRVDRVREPYSRRPVDRPRSGVFAGSTNQHEYFKDPTGSRRFWPVAVSNDIEMAKLAEWRDQLFAEAMVKLKEGERYHPTREELKAHIEPEQEAREIQDPWYERISLWVDSPEQSLTTSYTSSEILSGALHVPADRIDGGRQMATRVGIAMRKLGWDKVRDSTGARLWRYVRPKKTSALDDMAVAPVPQAGGPASDWAPESWEPTDGT